MHSLKKSLFRPGLIMLISTFISGSVLADPVFFDDFEDRVKDQALIGPGWTWYNQAFSDNECTTYLSGFGPYDEDGSGATYLQQNRNYWTASADVGQGDSYFRAGLEVPAWATDEGEKVVLSNMLRVYGNQYYAPTGDVSCKRNLIFQEMTVDAAGGFTFSFDAAMDRTGAPAFGEVTKAFVKVLDVNNNYDEVIFERVETMPPVSSTPENASTAFQAIDFTLTEEMAGMLLQFGFYVDIVESLGQGWGTSAVLYDNVMVTATDIGPAHSGSWYNVDESGHGFSIEFGPSPADGTPLAIVYWYTYDDAGNPIFMVGTGIPDGKEVVINFESPIGMKYGEFDPDSVTREVGGVAMFSFSDRDTATFSYTPSAFSETTWGHTTTIENLPLIKAFGIPADNNFSDIE